MGTEKGERDVWLEGEEGSERQMGMSNWAERRRPWPTCTIIASPMASSTNGERGEKDMKEEKEEKERDKEKKKGEKKRSVLFPFFSPISLSYRGSLKEKYKKATSSRQRDGPNHNQKVDQTRGRTYRGSTRREGVFPSSSSSSANLRR